jgi:hypothetical protein
MWAHSKSPGSETRHWQTKPKELGEKLAPMILRISVSRRKGTTRKLQT